MPTRLLATLPLLTGAAAAQADTGLASDGVAFAGLAVLGLSAIAVLGLAAKERRREQNRPAPVRLRAKARRYNQP